MITRKEKSKILETHCLAFLLMFSFLSYFLNVLIQNCFKIPVSVSIIFYGLAMLIGVFSYYKVCTRGDVLSILITILFVLGTVFFSLLNKEYVSLIYISFEKIAYSPALFLFFFCLPTLFFVLGCNVDYKKLFAYIIFYSRIILIIFLVAYVVFDFATSSPGGTYMSFSYNALVATCACILSKSDSKWKTIFDKVLGLLSCVIIFVAGARGCLVCLAGFFAALFVTSRSISFSKKVFIIILVSIVGLIIIINFKSIIHSIYLFLSARDIHSRTLEKLMDSSFINGSDRFKLWAKVFDALKKSPVLGYGLWGDRPIVNGYSHNLFVELLCSFGYILGTAIILALLFGILHLFIGCKRLELWVRNMFLIALTYGFFQLMVSDTYLVNIWFFALFGLLIVFRHNRTENNVTLLSDENICRTELSYEK